MKPSTDNTLNGLPKMISNQQIEKLIKKGLGLNIIYLPDVDKYYLITNNRQFDSRKQNKYFKSCEVNDAVLKFYSYILGQQIPTNGR